ncbi:MAG: hypothetical protein LBE97_00215 [Holosporales bacterium]|jgi:hypothetical protein|nr:hypothetical protein [Holosporales bacterium]
MTQNNKNTYVSLKIPITVKRRIDFLKGRQTYGGFLEDAIGFFEMTGVNPKLNQLPPAMTITKSIVDSTKDVLKRIDDLFKMLRNMESKKIDVILHTVEGNLKPGLSEDVISVNDLEVQQIIKINEQLTNENSRLKEHIKNSKSTNREQAIEWIAIIQDLLSDSSLGLDKDGNLTMTKDYRNLLIEKIRQLANDC